MNDAAIHSYSVTDQARLADQTGNIFTDIGKGNVPLGNFQAQGTWSLLSMLLSVLSIVSVILFEMYRLIQKRHDIDVNVYNDTDFDNDINTKDTKKKRTILGIIAAIFAFATPIAWLILDDTSLKMSWINNHTAFVAVLFVLYVVAIAAFAISNKKAKRIEQEVVA
ncbi:MAG: hypothetical protein LBN22_11535 [Clostridiales Family XIII bacterium]|nr:hypothetical protein [Clostridiales Family XIII bacterium]